MGTPFKFQTNYNMWVAIIPNSQLILFPYPKESPADWTLELFINPSASLLLVGIALLVTLTVLGLTIAYYWYKEKKEDQQDTQTEQLFAF